jgi:Flp pilus assembly protein CpaB
VDVQVLSAGKPDRLSEQEIRTVLQNVSVLSIHASPDPASNGGPALPSVTLLVTPAEADVLALADSTTRVRLSLRNPSDSVTDPRPSLQLGTLLRNGTPAR